MPDRIRVVARPDNRDIDLTINNRLEYSDRTDPHPDDMETIYKKINELSINDMI